MDRSKLTRSVTDHTHYLVYTLLFVGVFYILISTNPTQFHIPWQDPPCRSPPINGQFTMTIYRDKLEVELARAATKGKTVIIAVVNKAYVEGDKPMLDMFLDGFWVGENTRPLIRHILIVAVDQTSYDRCMFLRLRCYKLESDVGDFVGEKLYMSPDFIEMMWRRTKFLGDVLRLGYNFIFTDADVLWLRDPFPKLTTQNGTLDLQISTDGSNSGENPINTGFYMIRSNNRTVSLFETWYAMKDTWTGFKEQDVLNELLRQGTFDKLGITVKLLETRFFSGFCEDSDDVSAVVTVHANCCRSITAKLKDLTAVIHDWKRYRAFSGDGNRTTSFNWTEHVHCVNSWN